MKSIREAQIEKTLTKLFGETDENNCEFKSLLKMSIENKYDENVIKEIHRKREEDLKYILDKFEIIIDKNNMDSNNIANE